MKKLAQLTITCSLLLLWPAVSQAGINRTGDNNSAISMQIQQTITFKQSDLSFGELMGYDLIELKDCTYLNEPGKPMLPSKIVKIALPEGMVSSNVRIVETNAVDIDGNYSIYPSQPARRLSQSRDIVDFIEPDNNVYASSQPYPSQIASLIYQTDLAGQAMAVLRINPIQYIPEEGKLILYTSITFAVEGTSGYECGDYLPENISGERKEKYRIMIRDMVINPEDVSLVSNSPTIAGVGPGSYDYVIVTSSSWEDDFQPLADWKTQKGVEATIVTTDWIYNSGGYSGTNVNKIRLFVNDAYSTWGAAYFLIGGDTPTVPAHSRYLCGDNIPNDSYYGDFDSDWTCEVHVGRASVTSTSAISTFINKILTYEKNPPSNYPKKAALFGFDLDYSTDGEDCKIDIYNYYFPSGWTMTNVYDSHSGDHEINVINAVNAGQNLINHIDHCYEDEIGTGITNHGWYLSKSQVDAFNNGDKQSIFYSIGCWALAYDYSNCIGEHFVRDTNGGGVAFVGNSRYGWYYSGNTNTLSMLYDRYFFRSLFSQNHYVLGECFSDHKNDGPTSDDYEKYIFTELTLMGDPELNIWTDNPSSFVVTHPSSLPQGQSSFNVHVAQSGGGNIDQAYVCLWKDGDVFETGYTNSSGNAELTPSPSSMGTMYVTVTKHNFLPYEGEAQVTSGGGPDVSIDMVPDTYPIYVSRGGNFTYTGILENNTGSTHYVDVWLMLGLPGGSQYGPLQQYNNVPMAPYQNITIPGISQYIPVYAPVGTYDYIAYCGDYPSPIMDSVSFEFTIVPWGTGTSEDWNLSGWKGFGIEDIPVEFALMPNYPNPFNVQTNISFDIPKAGHVALEVYNILGQRVENLINEYTETGHHVVTWDASHYSSGVYFYKLTAGGNLIIKQMMLVK